MISCSTRACSAQIRTPLCLDESISGPQAAADALDLGACRIINIKPGRMGGLGPSLAVHEIARARAIPLWHGGMLESGIGRAHNLHLSTLPGFTLPGDVAASRRYFVPDLIDPPIEVAPDGTIAVPSGAGIGVDPVPERVRAATRPPGKVRGVRFVVVVRSRRSFLVDWVPACWPSGASRRPHPRR